MIPFIRYKPAYVTQSALYGAVREGGGRGDGGREEREEEGREKGEEERREETGRRVG